MQQLLRRSTRLVRFLVNFCMRACAFFLALPSLQPPSPLGRSGCLTILTFGNNLFLALFFVWSSQSGEDVSHVRIGEFYVDVLWSHWPEHSHGDLIELHTTTWCELRKVHFHVFRYQKTIVLSGFSELGDGLVLFHRSKHVLAQPRGARFISLVCMHVPRHIYKISQAKKKNYMWHPNVFYNPTRSQCVWDWVALLPCVRPPDHVEVMRFALRVSVHALASHQQTQGRIWLGQGYEGPAIMLLGLRKPPALVNRDPVHSRDVDGARAPVISDFQAILLALAIDIASSCHCTCRQDRLQHRLGLCIIWPTCDAFSLM